MCTVLEEECVGYYTYSMGGVEHKIDLYISDSCSLWHDLCCFWNCSSLVEDHCELLVNKKLGPSHFTMTN